MQLIEEEKPNKVL